MSKELTNSIKIKVGQTALELLIHKQHFVPNISTFNNVCTSMARSTKTKIKNKKINKRKKTSTTTKLLSCTIFFFKYMNIYEGWRSHRRSHTCTLSITWVPFPIKCMMKKSKNLTWNMPKCEAEQLLSVVVHHGGLHSVCHRVYWCSEEECQTVLGHAGLRTSSSVKADTAWHHPHHNAKPGHW